MIRFECDYTEGCLPEILNLLVGTNMEQTPGYGDDEYCKKAAELVKRDFKAPDADVYFIHGGTPTNKTVIQSYLKPFQGVISRDTGHINTHEVGTIEAGGHKVIPIASPDGKITARQVRDAVKNCKGDFHMVQPAMVYISNPTEYGTIYSKKELEELKAACKENDLTLYCDGARLGYALASEENDVSPEDYAKIFDVFYIGGTKVGALFGEAVVITNPEIKKDFRYSVKQNGGLLAKGRLLGIQFLGLFSDGAYYRAGEHGTKLAMKIKEALKARGVKFAYDSPTNQQFVILSDEETERISEKYSVSVQGKMQGGNLVRICTSWATKEENVDALIADLDKILEK